MSGMPREGQKNGKQHTIIPLVHVCSSMVWATNPKLLVVDLKCGPFEGDVTETNV